MIISNSISIGRPVIQSSAPSLLLDIFGTNVLGAYSLRKLSSSYTGAAIRVRRDTDNAEQDIGFDSNGDLDTSALNAFVPDNGYVVKWYDQSGNGRDGTQISANKQLQVVSSNALITKNSLPTTQGGNSKHVNISGFPTTSQPYTIFEIYAHDTATGAGTSFTFTSGTGSNRLENNVQRFVSFGLFTKFSGTTNSLSTTQHQDTDLHVVTRMVNGSSSVLRVDQTTETLNNNPQSGTQLANTGTSTIGINATPSYRGNLSEVIVYGADKTSDFTNIETDMKTYYSTP